MTAAEENQLRRSGRDEGRVTAESKKARTERIVRELLLEHEARSELPTNARFVFYELEQRGQATKPQPDDARPNRRRSHGWPPGSQDVTDALTRLREQGAIPWTWIEDEERSLTEWPYAGSVADYLRERLAEATINPFGDDPPPLILCESKAMAGVLRPIVYAYACPIAGLKGQSGGFLRTAVAPLVADSRQVLYLGDHDRCGFDIEANTRCVLERETGIPSRWNRLGLTDKQASGIEPIWKVDGRDRKGHWAWEVESLGQTAAVALVRQGLERLLPEPLADVRERERQERERLAVLLEAA